MNGKKATAGFFSAAGVLLLIGAASPVKADESVTVTTGDLRIYEISMNDQNPLETLKSEVIEQRAAYDAAVNLSQVDYEASVISADSFDRTKTGLQNISISVTVNKQDQNADTSGYSFSETAAVRMIAPEGPQVILKSETVTVDLGGVFSYSDNIGYVSSKDGKLPVIKETDNVDVTTEGDYTCSLEFIDAAGKKTNISFQVAVRKPAEVIRAEEEAAAAAEAARLEEEARLAAQQQALLAAMQSSVGSYSGSSSDIVNYAMQFVGCNYVYGGTSPAGFDCSGFTQYVYAHFGISLPRSSYQQEYVGTIIPVSEAQPGDLVTYSGHAAIYIGNGQIVNAMNPSQGVAVCSIYAISNGNMQVHRLS